MIIARLDQRYGLPPTAPVAQGLAFGTRIFYLSGTGSDGCIAQERPLQRRHAPDKHNSDHDRRETEGVSEHG